MSIVRIGLGETKKFAEGYEAIFGKKSAGTTQAEPTPSAESTQGKRKKDKKGKKKKK